MHLFDHANPIYPRKALLLISTIPGVCASPQIEVRSVRDGGGQTIVLSIAF